MSSPITDPFMPNYYNPSMSFPYLGQGLGDGAWSNGGDTSMFSAVGGYDYNGMFSGFGYPQFWGEYQPSEYWGQNATAQGQGRKDARGYPTEDYYRMDNMVATDPYSAMNGDMERDPAVASMEQGLKGMNISMENQMEGGTSNELQHASMDPSVQAGNVQHTGSSQAPKKTSWAAIASQPARPQPQKPRSIPRAPVNPSRQNLDIGTWDSNKNSAAGGADSLHLSKQGIGVHQDQLVLQQVTVVLEILGTLFLPKVLLVEMLDYLQLVLLLQVVPMELLILC